MASRRELANAIRALSMDAVQRANSGHPGMPMGMADIAEVLWNDHLKHNPGNPDWPDRDRFVVSNGHGSMLLYSLLHLSGYDLAMTELQNFRQLQSKTPGHPEYGYTPGVETTTGPLGQGLANAVGMALAEQSLAAEFNRPGHDIVDHTTFAFLGDGCLMEGISHEVCSLAGTFELGKLICVYDDNGISIDGNVSAWFSEDVPKRFEAYGWQVIPEVDGHDADAVDWAIRSARSQRDKPSIICCKTTIAFGAPNKQNTAGAHGAPLGEAEIAAARKQLDWPYEPFQIPDDIYSGWNATEKGEQAESSWQQRLEAYAQEYPELAAEFARRMRAELPPGFSKACAGYLEQVTADGTSMASRQASQQTLNAYAPGLPELIGGSADLTGSNLTRWKDAEAFSAKTPAGRYVYYGVREFGMTAIANGIALHGGLIPFTGTFLVFSDYARNALRMAALMGIRTISVLTHDSIGLGEDGPTHQPIEHAATLRQIPNMSVWRPCDAVETAIAWRAALERRSGPSCLLFSRQSLPHQKREPTCIDDIQRGGYILQDCADQPQVILIATGSEVSLAVEAAGTLTAEGLRVRVVSMPCTDVFDAQDEDYREHVLPSSVRTRVAVEAGSRLFWHKYTGLDGACIGLDTFGESAPYQTVYEYFGITAGAVADAARKLLAGA